jgi:hypothetical protein
MTLRYTAAAGCPFIGLLVSIMNPPPYPGILVEAAIVLAVLSIIYRLNTWSSQAT